MPRSTSAAFSGFALALAAAGASAPDARAQILAQPTSPVILRVDKHEDGSVTLTVLRPGTDPGGGEDEPKAAPMPKTGISRAFPDIAIFGSTRNYRNARASLEAILVAKLEVAGQDRPLSDTQKKTLRLAGWGDIKRFLDRVDGVRAVFDGHGQMRIMRDDALQLAAALRPFRSDYEHGPFGDGSLFAKALHSIREREQAASNGAR
jgi:hypothetical protein